MIEEERYDRERNAIESQRNEQLKNTMQSSFEKNTVVELGKVITIPITNRVW